MNSEIRTLQFNQGVGVTTPPSGDGGSKVSLTNNSANNITALGYYLDSFIAAVIEYYIYRRTDSGFKWMKGKISLVGVPDAVLNADKWDFNEDERTEKLGDMGIIFSLSSVDTEKSILVATLDNMAGANHAATMYYKVSTLIA